MDKAFLKSVFYLSMTVKYKSIKCVLLNAPDVVQCKICDHILNPKAHLRQSSCCQDHNTVIKKPKVSRPEPKTHWPAVFTETEDGRVAPIITTFSIHAAVVNFESGARLLRRKRIYLIMEETNKQKLQQLEQPIRDRTAQMTKHEEPTRSRKRKTHNERKTNTTTLWASHKL